MAEQRVRIGIVGAGKNTRERHVPGFRNLPDVELVGVANRTPDSTARAAKELGIGAQLAGQRLDPLQFVVSQLVDGERVRVVGLVPGRSGTEDEPHAPGVEIGKPSETYRRVRVRSTFGLLTILVTDGHLPFPYGREMTGYEVANLSDLLTKAKAAGVSVLIAPYTADHRSAAMVQFPGGYIAEIHSIAK